MTSYMSDSPRERLGYSLEYDTDEPRPVAERRVYEIVREAHEAALLMEARQ